MISVAAYEVTEMQGVEGRVGGVVGFEESSKIFLLLKMKGLFVLHSTLKKFLAKMTMTVM
jgi:hypothetical protein